MFCGRGSGSCRPDFSTEAILNEADLTGADLQWADLPRAHLDTADLTRARRVGAILTGGTVARPKIISVGGTYLVRRVRGRRRRGARWVRVGAPEVSLTPTAGMAAVTELVERLGVVAAVDAAVGPIKTRERGFGAGQLLVGMAASPLDIFRSRSWLAR